MILSTLVVLYKVDKLDKCGKSGRDKLEESTVMQEVIAFEEGKGCN